MGCVLLLESAQVSLKLSRCVIAPLNRGQAVVRKTVAGPVFVINDRDANNSNCACR